MDQLKINNFINEYPNCQFPEYVSLSQGECALIVGSIKDKFFIPNAYIGLSLVKFIADLAVPCKGISCAEEDFNPNLFLDVCDIKLEGYVYINWYQYDRIDKIRSFDFIKYFHDIWYYELDDIDIFNDSFNWILLIRHDGFLKMLR